MEGLHGLHPSDERSAAPGFGRHAVGAYGAGGLFTVVSEGP
jgi:hypothetical protein